MKVTELTREQLKELKAHDLIMQRDERDEGVSYYELVNIDELISDEEIIEAYAGTEFSPDDFGI